MIVTVGEGKRLPAAVDEGGGDGEAEFVGVGGVPGAGGEVEERGAVGSDVADAVNDEGGNGEEGGAVFAEFEFDAGTGGRRVFTDVDKDDSEGSFGKVEAVGLASVIVPAANGGRRGVDLVDVDDGIGQGGRYGL